MKKVTVRFSDEVHEAIKAAAGHNRRSLNSEIVTAVVFYLNNALFAVGDGGRGACIPALCPMETGYNKGGAEKE